jgi:hypothetical protein
MTIKKSTIAIIGIIVVVVIAAAYGWYHNPFTLSKTQFTALPSIPAVAKVPTVDISVKKVVALDKKSVNKKLKLPDDIVNDDKKQYLATSQTPATDTTGKTDIVTVLDTEKGTAQNIAIQEPLSFFALENHKAVGLRYGFGSASKINYEADAYARWDVVRVGAVHLGLYGEVNSLGDGKAMIQAEYRF